jgi:glycosyltransferase involved in cell wall biosynthesis
MDTATDHAMTNAPPGYRVLVVCNDGEYFLRHRLPVVTHLSSIGVEVTVIAGGNPIPTDRIQGWKYIHARIARFSFDPIGDAALTVRTARVIRYLKPDAVHLITFKPAIFSGAASVLSRFVHGHPKRILVTLPGLGRMMSTSKGPGERRYPVAAILTRLVLWILARNEGVHFTFETKSDRDVWVKWGIATNQNSSIISGAGVDPDRFYPSDALRRDSEIKVLFASRLLKSKGLIAFLMMARNLAGRSDVRFIVAGLPDDQDSDAIRHVDIKRLSEISFLGYVEDMPSLLRQCDVVCAPTRYGEGIPRILIEAGATGLASIASDHPGCREILKDGITGQILSATSDIDMSRELSAAVVQYLEIPGRLKQHKEAAYRYFESREFNQRAITARFVELLGSDSRFQKEMPPEMLAR